MQFCELINHDRVDEVKRRLASNPKLANARDANGVPVLLLAVEAERPIITRLLVKSGADPVAKSQMQGRAEETPLGASLRLERPFITRLLVRRFMRAEYFERNKFLSARELERNFVSAEDKRTMRRTLVEIYADLPVLQLVNGIAKDFRMHPAGTLLVRIREDSNSYLEVSSARVLSCRPPCWCVPRAAGPRDARCGDGAHGAAREQQPRTRRRVQELERQAPVGGVRVPPLDWHTQGRPREGMRHEISIPPQHE